MWMNTIRRPRCLNISKALISGIPNRSIQFNKLYDGSIVTTVILSVVVLSTSYFHYKTATKCDQDQHVGGVSYEAGQTITNWSSTHACEPLRFYEPKSAQEVCRILERHQSTKTKIRPIGTALSPNGIGMAANGNILSVSSIDYVEVDKKRHLVTVGAGAKVSEVLKELNKHGLTLENFSSIQEQQMGGWTQVAAHGTGCTLPTVEEMIVRMKLATLTEGLLTLSNTSNPRLFSMAKVGLGSLGVVTELTLRCIPKHQLLEYTYTIDEKDISHNHYEKLANYRHVRYMWLPFTNKVVVVVSNPLTSSSDNNSGNGNMTSKDNSIAFAAVEKDVVISVDKCKANNNTGSYPTEAMAELLFSLRPTLNHKTVRNMTFSQLRDSLLDIAPLDVAHIKKVNQAESVFWQRSAGSRTDDSTSILGFDCGGAQWVLEVCFPIGSLEQRTGKDLQFVQRLLQLIEKYQLPAPCPIEQRWTASSSAAMSPAAASTAATAGSSNGSNTASSSSSSDNTVFSWVGIIMYMPPEQNEAQRAIIAEQFQQYTALCLRPLMEEYGAVYHWAKIELPAGDNNCNRKDNDSLQHQAQKKENELDFLRTQLAKAYPIEEFNQYRAALDPNHILSNELIEKLFD